MNVAWAVAYCRMNDHKMPREYAIQGELDREAMRILWQEVERIRKALTTPGPEDEELGVDVDDFPLF